MERTYLEKKALNHLGYISGMAVGQLISTAINAHFPDPLRQYKKFHALYEAVFNKVKEDCVKMHFGEGKGRKYYYLKTSAEAVIEKACAKLKEEGAK